MNDFVSLWDGGPKFRQSEHFKLGTDSVLLADFVNIGSRRKGIDLGCGSGILPLLLLSRDARLCMTGLEINPEAAEAARDNLTANGLSGRGSVVVGDIRRVKEHFRSGEFDPRRILPRAAAGKARMKPRLRHARKPIARSMISAERQRICAARAACSALCTGQSACAMCCVPCVKTGLSRSACARCRTMRKKSRLLCSLRHAVAEVRD